MEKENRIRRIQIDQVGARYAGAVLANLDFQDKEKNKINSWFKNPKGLLLMMGDPGVGKSYFCSAALHWMFDKVEHLRFYKDRDILSKIRRSIGEDKGDYSVAVKACMDDEFVIIDDLGSSTINDWRRDIWFEIIDQRIDSLKPTIICTNYTRLEIFEELGKRTASRLLSKENLIIDLHGYPDKRQE